MKLRLHHPIFFLTVDTERDINLWNDIMPTLKKWYHFFMGIPTQYHHFTHLPSCYHAILSMLLSYSLCNFTPISSFESNISLLLSQQHYDITPVSSWYQANIIFACQYHDNITWYHSGIIECNSSITISTKLNDFASRLLGYCYEYKCII